MHYCRMGKTALDALESAQESYSFVYNKSFVDIITLISKIPITRSGNFGVRVFSWLSLNEEIFLAK